MKKTFIIGFLCSFIILFVLFFVIVQSQSNEQVTQKNTTNEKQIYETFNKLDKEYVEKEFEKDPNTSSEVIDAVEKKALTETATQYSVTEDTVKSIIVRLTEQKYK